jgi:hypothetical protein
MSNKTISSLNNEIHSLQGSGQIVFNAASNAQKNALLKYNQKKGYMPQYLKEYKNRMNKSTANKNRMNKSNANKNRMNKSNANKNRMNTTQNKDPWYNGLSQKGKHAYLDNALHHMEGQRNGGNSYYEKL